MGNGLTSTDKKKTLIYVFNLFIFERNLLLLFKSGREKDLNFFSL